MRQGQKPNKNRGRNRRQPNSANRVFESNGPDVKVRGNASHVSEKYMNLARDAQSTGDPIAAENYLQHAEHYLRIIAANAAQQQKDAAPCAPRSEDDTEAASSDRANGAAQADNGHVNGEADAGGSGRHEQSSRPRRGPRGRSGDRRPQNERNSTAGERSGAVESDGAETGDDSTPAAATAEPVAEVIEVVTPEAETPAVEAAPEVSAEVTQETPADAPVDDDAVRDAS